MTLDKHQALKLGNREAIKAAALEMARDRGLASFTVTELAERSGVSRRTFFNHFGSIDDAIHAGLRDLVLAHFEALTAQLEGAKVASIAELFERIEGVLLSANLDHLILQIQQIVGAEPKENRAFAAWLPGILSTVAEDLQSVARRRPVGMIQFDSHTDLNDIYFGTGRYTHGTPFRRAVEEGLIDPKRYVLIGIRGTAYGREDWDFAEANGIRIIPVGEFHRRGVEDVMAEARSIVGSGPTYVTYDIDFVDPTFAPGTGTPEVGGPNSWQALEVARGLRGLDLVGADLVEVSPPFDPSGGTAWLGISLMFEMLCVMAEAVARRAVG